MYKLLLFFISFLYSCSVQSTLSIQTDLTGTVQSTINLNPDFAKNYVKLGQSLGLKIEPNLLEEQRIKLYLEQNPYIIAKTIKKTNNILNIDFNTKSIPYLTPKKEVFALNPRGSNQEFTLKLNRNNAASIFNFLGKDYESLKDFLPSNTNPISESEYLDLLTYIFGATMKNIATLIKQSFITLEVQFPKDIISYNAGEKINPKTIRYRIPLIQILSLEKSLNYSVVF